MRSSQIVFISIFVSIALFIVAFFSYENFIDLVKPNYPNVHYSLGKDNNEFNDSVIFSFSIGLIPFVSAVLWKYGQIRRIGKRIASIAIIILFILVFALGRIMLVQNNIADVRAKAAEDNSPAYVLVNDFNIEWFMGIGLFTGGFIAFVTLRKTSDGKR